MGAPAAVQVCTEVLAQRDLGQNGHGVRRTLSPPARPKRLRAAVTTYRMPLAAASARTWSRRTTCQALLSTKLALGVVRIDQVVEAIIQLGCAIDQTHGTEPIQSSLSLASSSLGVWIMLIAPHHPTAIAPGPFWGRRQWRLLAGRNGFLVGLPVVCNGSQRGESSGSS